MRPGGRQHDSRKVQRRVASVASVCAVLLLAGAILLTSCTEPTAPSVVWVVTDYSVPIDSMRVTSPIVLGDTLRVWLWGEVGPAPCYEFYSIWASQWTDWEVYLDAHGAMRSGGPCDGPITYLEGEEYAYVPPAEGLVQIHAYPGLVETVEVVSRQSWESGARSN